MLLGTPKLRNAEWRSGLSGTKCLTMRRRGKA